MALPPHATSTVASQPLQRSTSNPNPWTFSSIAVASAVSPHQMLVSECVSMNSCDAPVAPRSLSQSIGAPDIHTVTLPPASSSTGIAPIEPLDMWVTVWADPKPVAIAMASYQLVAPNACSHLVSIRDVGADDEPTGSHSFDWANVVSRSIGASSQPTRSRTTQPVDSPLRDDPCATDSLIESASIAIFCEPAVGKSIGQFPANPCETITISSDAASSLRTSFLAQQAHLQRPADRAILAPYLAPKFHLPVDLTTLPAAVGGTEIAIGISTRENPGAQQFAIPIHLAMSKESSEIGNSLAARASHRPVNLPPPTPAQEPHNTTARRIEVACHVECATRCVSKPRADLVRALSRFSVRAGYRGSSAVIARSTTAPITLLAEPIRTTTADVWTLALATNLRESLHRACQTLAHVVADARSCHRIPIVDQHSGASPLLAFAAQAAFPTPVINPKVVIPSDHPLRYRALVIGLQRTSLGTDRAEDADRISPLLFAPFDTLMERLHGSAAPVAIGSPTSTEDLKPIVDVTSQAIAPLMVAALPQNRVALDAA